MTLLAHFWMQKVKMRNGMFWWSGHSATASWDFELRSVHFGWMDQDCETHITTLKPSKSISFFHEIVKETNLVLGCLSHLTCGPETNSLPTAARSRAPQTCSQGVAPQRVGLHSSTSARHGKPQVSLHRKVDRPVHESKSVRALGRT